MGTGQQKRRKGRSQQFARNELQASTSAETREGMIGHYPMSSVLVVFGIGLGVGMAIGCALSGSSTPPTFGERAEHVAERVGRQVLDAMAQVLPQSLAKHVA